MGSGFLRLEPLEFRARTLLLVRDQGISLQILLVASR